jgi:hypothetical protein
MTALAIAALQIVAPGLLGGSLGVVISILRHPMAGKVAKIAKGAARGEHLSQADKTFIKKYNTGRTDAQIVHGW